MPKTDFLSRDIVSCIRDTIGLKDPAPMPTPPDMYVDKETDIGITASYAQFEVAIVSTFQESQRLKLVGLDAWFPAEDFTLVRRVSKGQKVNDAPKCIHCQYPRSRHSEKDGHCLRAGFMGNKFDPAPEPQWTPPVGKLLEAGVERVDLNNLYPGQWLLVAAQVKHKGSEEAGIECRVYDPKGEEYFIFTRSEAVMGQIEQPDWAKPPLPDEPPIWTVVKTVGPPGPGGPITIHVRTKANKTCWVDLSGNRREWSEVCRLDANGKPTVLKPEEDEMGMFD